MKSNYIYNISSNLKKIILKHGFTEKEIYPKCDNNELKKYVTISKSKNINTIDKSYDKLKEMKIILGKPVSLCLINYIIRKNITEEEIINEKVKTFLDRVATEFNCLNKVYLPNFLNNSDYQKDIFEIRDILLSRLPKLKSFYKNYRNISAFYLLKHYGISIFHLEFLKFEFEHPYEAVYFEKLQQLLLNFDENRFEKLRPAVDYVYQNNSIGFLEKNCNVVKKDNNSKPNKLFIINQINQTVYEQLNSIDEEIVDNYDDLNPDISNIDEEIDILNQLISKCHNICIKYSISNYVIKYVFGIQFLTF